MPISSPLAARPDRRAEPENCYGAYNVPADPLVGRLLGDSQRRDRGQDNGQDSGHAPRSVSVLLVSHHVRLRANFVGPSWADDSCWSLLKKSRSGSLAEPRALEMKSRFRLHTRAIRQQSISAGVCRSSAFRRNFRTVCCLKAELQPKIGTVLPSWPGLAALFSFAHTASTA